MRGSHRVREGTTDRVAAAVSHRQSRRSQSGCGGLRAGEISALRWEDADLQKGSIHVLRSFDQKSGETVLPKTDKSTRLVWMPPQLVEILEQYRAVSAVEFGAERIAPEKLVFTSSTGGNLRSAVVANRMNKVWAAHGLRRIMLHEARHTYASLAAAAKMPIQVLSKMMGHSSISVTMDLYAHLYAHLYAKMCRTRRRSSVST